MPATSSNHLLLRCFRLSGACLLLALTASSCGSSPSTRVEAAGVAALAPAASPPPVPVAPLIQALLDTATAGHNSTADARRGLQAGNAVRAFYGAAYTPAWTQPADSLNANARAALALLARAADHGLRPADYGGPRLRALRDSLARPTTAQSPLQRAHLQAQIEVYLSDAVLTFMRDVGRGRLHPYTASARERAGGAAGQPVAALRAALASGTVPAAMVAGQPANREYRQLQQALAHWRSLPMPTAPDSVRQHQAHFQQAAVNLERWRWEAFAPDSDYVLINVPAYELQVVAAGAVARRHRVIVGKPGTTTPTLSSTIRYFTLAPGWHVPNSIATQEMLPRIRRDVGYLERNNLAIYNTQGKQLDPTRINWAKVTPQRFPYIIRQSACCDNALGNIVFRFTNPYSVYLHDTPLRQLFDRPTRALSHGCIRLEQPMRLAAYLLSREGNPARLPTEDECARSPRSRDIRLRRPMALYVRYATCTAENGRLRFLPDIYGRDEVLRHGLFGPKPTARASKPVVLGATSARDTAEFDAK